jgi:hypothetical protein
MLNAREPKIVNGPEILNKYVGASEENIRKLFADAEKEVCAFHWPSPVNSSSFSIKTRETRVASILSFSMNWMLSSNNGEVSITEPGSVIPSLTSSYPRQACISYARIVRSKRLLDGRC